MKMFIWFSPRKCRLGRRAQLHAVGNRECPDSRRLVQRAHRQVYGIDVASVPHTPARIHFRSGVASATVAHDRVATVGVAGNQALGAGAMGGFVRNRARPRLAMAIALAAIVAMPVPAAAAGERRVWLNMFAAYPSYAAYSNTFWYIDLSFPDGSTSPSATGTIDIYEVPDLGGDVFVKSFAFDGVNQVNFSDQAGFSAGTHTFRGVFTPNDATYQQGSGMVTLQFNNTTSNTLIDGPSQVDANNGFQLSAVIEYGSTNFYQGTTVAFRRSGVATPVCTVAVTQANQQTCDVPGLPVGTHQFTAEYSGTSYMSGSTSSPLTVTVVNDTVHSSGVGVVYSTFYPVTDNYRDTLGIRGTRLEPISVSIKIYNASNTLMRSAAFAEASGFYQYVWNGRTSAGSIRPEGKYRVVQTLKDHNGNTQTVTSYTTLSKKFLHWKTVDITEKGSNYVAVGKANGGTVTRNTTYGYAKLVAPSGSGVWAAAGWEFTLPSAVIYDWFKVRAYTRHTGSSSGTALAAWDFNECSDGMWFRSCFQGQVTIPATSGTTLYWRSSPSLPSNYRLGRIVRSLMSSSSGTTYIYKARLSVRYAYLAY
jgi:hypothetical protein